MDQRQVLTGTVGLSLDYGLPYPAAQWRQGKRAAERQEVTLYVLEALARHEWADLVAGSDRAGREPGPQAAIRQAPEE